MSERIIKRYTNRKLYDTRNSSYVTLEQIAEMIRDGDDVKIIDNKSKEDLTSVTLAQIIFEKEKKHKSFLPLQAMRNIIQTGGESIHQLFAQAQRKVTDITQDIIPGRDTEEAASPLQGATSSEGTSEEGISREGSGNIGSEITKHGPLAIREFREFLANSQRTIEEWQQRVDDRIRNVVGGISPFSRGLHSDVRSLADRISELEAKLAKIAHEEE